MTATSVKIAALLEEARRRAADPDEVGRQRLSFAFGNGNVEGDAFSRATMSVVLPPAFDVSTGAAATVAPEQYLHRHDAEGALRQADAALAIISRFTDAGASRFLLDRNMIVGLHDTMREKNEGAGLRTTEVRIAGSSLGPPPPDAVARELDELCDGINARWEEDDALDLAARALWRLNWIHPFTDGNGRTARAVSYVVLNVRLGGLVPGTPTVPEQLLHRRAEYIDALAQADAAWIAGRSDLLALRNLLGEMLARQLGAAPALSEGEIYEIDEMVSRRLDVRGDSTSEGLGAAHSWRLWSVGDHVVLQVASEPTIREAEARLRQHGDPFPHLLAGNPADATIRIEAGRRGAIVQGQDLWTDGGAALGFERNAAATIERPTVRWTDGSHAYAWSADGALHVLRFGRELTSAAARDTLDLLLTRHLAGFGR